MTEIVTDMPNEDYHQHRAVGASGLKLINQSPLHYWARYLDPEREPDAPTDAMKLGTAVHCALLEPAEFVNRYTVVPEGIDKRSKAGKELFAEIEAGGKEPLKPKQEPQISKMQQAAFNHPMMRILLSHPEKLIEKSLFWTDQETGVVCKMRPDLMLPPGAERFPLGYLLDLKSTEDASASEFPRQVWNLDMLIQAAWYTDGFMQIYKTDKAPPFVWFAQENSPPFANKPYKATPEQIEHGRNEYRRLLAIYADCVSTSNWPGYGVEILELELPGWAQRIIETTDQLEIEDISYVTE